MDIDRVDADRRRLSLLVGGVRSRTRSGSKVTELPGSSVVGRWVVFPLGHPLGSHLVVSESRDCGHLDEVERTGRVSDAIDAGRDPKVTILADGGPGPHGVAGLSPSTQ